MITCFLRYTIDPTKIEAFEAYGERWIELVGRFGGHHHGYFLPAEGANNVALALFSFSSLAAYEGYREAASRDPDCLAAYDHAEKTGCILAYERSFFRPVRPSDADRSGPPDAADDLRAGLVTAATMLHDFYDGLEERPVAPASDRAEVAKPFEGSLGERGAGLPETLREVREHVLPHAMAVPHPLYLGLLNSSPLTGGIVADSIIGALNNNAGAWQQGPPFVAAEQEVIRRFTELFGMSEETVGLVLPGGSYTALHGLQLARSARLPMWRERGPRALPGNPRVYVSEAAHFSAVRAAEAIGVAPHDIVRVPTKGRGSMDVGALATILAEDLARGDLPFAVVATLGTTGTGAIDPVAELADLCRTHDLWLHVDACYGGAGALLEELSDHFRGLARADSVAVDPHKWFFVPMVAGLILTPHAEVELQAFDVDASYIPADDEVDGFRRGLPTSRRCSGFAIWMAFRAHGLAAIRDAVRRNIDLARRLETALRQRGFHVMDGGELSVACARWEPPGRTDDEIDLEQERIASAVVASGHAWFGTVRVAGRTWLRFALVSRLTRERHIDRLADRLEAIATGGVPEPS